MVSSSFSEHDSTTSVIDLAGYFTTFDGLTRIDGGVKRHRSNDAMSVCKIAIYRFV